MSALSGEEESQLELLLSHITSPYVVSICVDSRSCTFYHEDNFQLDYKLDTVFTTFDMSMNVIQSLEIVKSIT